VKGKTAILVDDMIDTGRTLALDAKTLKDAGAAKVYAHVSHGLLSGKATDLLRILSLERLVVTNTIPNLEKAQLSGGKLEIMDISAVIAESIRRTHNGESISLLFQEDAALLF
ncbi:ribose-phosphate pyrophosphokinase, partial [Salinisphaera sp. USBA-960]|nr:ribose-phosphate pyrophosphokinase [Salifodinibacter halophilus]